MSQKTIATSAALIISAVAFLGGFNLQEERDAEASAVASLSTSE